MKFLFIGIATIVTGGLLNGIFIFPIRFIKQWEWENMWLAFGFFGLFLLPTTIAFFAVPHLLAVYSAVPALKLALTCSMGISWGIGSLLFGLGVSALGMSLGYAIIMGTSALFGTLVPALLLSRATLLSWNNLKLAGSLALVCIALSLCAIAGLKRDRAASSAQYQTLTKTTFRKGLILSILSGILSACFNIGFATTTAISASAQHYGASRTSSTLSIWALIMSSGFIPSFFYCLYCLRRNHSLRLYTCAPQNWCHAFLMGALWIASVIIYGVGASLVGGSGAAIGWPILTSITIFTATLIGVANGEWNGARHIARRYLYPSLALLIAAVTVASMAGAH